MSEKIAILGGGIGALTTAFELTNVPDWQTKYDITVYQQGWRLGGKGASARNPDEHWRIEEHGPHVWFGFYFNAFHVIDEAYRYCRENALLPEGSFTSWDQAFHPKDASMLLDLVAGQWQTWSITLPFDGGSPLAPGETRLWAQILNGLNRLVEHLEKVNEQFPDRAVKLKVGSVTPARWLVAAHNVLGRLAGADVSKDAPSPRSVLHFAIQVARDLDVRLEDPLPWPLRKLRELTLWLIKYLLQRFLADFRSAFGDLLKDSAVVRHFWQLLDMGAAMLRGILDDHVLVKGLDAIENQDFSRWLERHGCLDSWSPVIRSIYDSGAHYEGGRSSPGANPNIRPDAANLAAGTAVHALLRMFGGYAGHFSYRMQAGMGECVMTPVYLALRHKGVKFAFFHRVTNLIIEGGEITGVELQVQAKVRQDLGQYQPLLPPFKGLLCWPPAPLYDQLENGDQIKASGADFESAWCDSHVGTITLKRGVDFHKVVLGITIAALPAVCNGLARIDPRWAAMLTGIKTVQTQFLEVWMKETSQQLAGLAGTPTAEGYLEPFDTWLDMSQILDREDWSGDVKSVHYFVGALEDLPDTPPSGAPSDFPEQQRAGVFRRALTFLGRRAVGLWPHAAVPGSSDQFDWSKMAAPESAVGEERFRSQYWRANVQPTERYVLSTAGSKWFRMRSDDSGFGNLFLAGDWTLNGLNAGSVEAAVMSGMQASQGISGYPLRILGGYAELDRRKPPAASGS